MSHLFHVPKALGEWRGLQREQEPPEQLSTGPWGSPEAALNFTIQLWAHQPCLGFRVTTAPLCLPAQRFNSV